MIEGKDQPGRETSSQRMNTLQIGDEWVEEREGGLARYFYELLRNLPSAGASARGMVVGPEAITQSTAGKVVAFAPADAGLMKRVHAARRIARELLRQERFDVIAIHFALYGLPILDRLGSTPSVVHFHGPWAGESGVEGQGDFAMRLKAAVERAVYLRASRLIVLSSSFRDELVRRYRVPEERVRVVPGGIDIDRFHVTLSRTEARELLGWPTDRPIMLSVRRQVRRMGLEDLINATKMLTVRHPDVLLLLGGFGPIHGELQARIESQGLTGNVRLLGRVPDADLPTAYRAADLSVVPTQSLEGFGLVTLESMASGTPVYVTPIGGLPEILRPFAPDCIFRDSSAASMAAVLGEALTGNKPGDEVCRAYAADNFAWPRIAEKVLAIYREALR